MKKFTHLRLLLAFLVCFSASQANAALLLEPVLGYSFGKVSYDEDRPLGLSDSDSEQMNGMSYGGRVGYQNLGFQLGLDYLASNMDADGNDFNTNEYAAFVGFEFPILVRAYAAYVFSGNAKAGQDSGSDLTLSGGTGPKVGVGLTLLPFLDVNVEYRRIGYDTVDLGAGFSRDYDYEAVMVGVSLPFTI